MKTLQSIADSTQSQRASSLRSIAEKAVNGKKEIAKILFIMVRTGDCPAGKMLKHAEKLTGKDLRKDLQGVYELVGILNAMDAGKIELTEEEFDTIETSKLSLLLPFINKPELADKLDSAIEAAKNGTAADIRALKPSNPKKEKEKAENENSQEGTKIDFAFICTDIDKNAPLLSSRQVLDRIRKDIEAFSEEEEKMDTMIDKLAKALVMACTLANVDGNEVLADIYASLAEKAQESSAPAIAA